MKRSYKGFTLIELLVVIAIIGLLSTLAVVALNSARQRSRDAKRVADIRQVQTALELGFSETGEYPFDVSGDTSAILGSSTATVLCKDSVASPNTSPIWDTNTAGCASGGTYMGLVPSAPTPPSGNEYRYFSSSTAAYKIMFTLEGDTGQLKTGANCANSNGIQAGSGC